MQKLIFLSLFIFFFVACKTSQLDVAHTVCLQEKIKGFKQDDKSWSVKWTTFKGGIVYKFSSVVEDVYLDEKCDTVCQYALISSYLPPCTIEIDNAANWQIIWEK